MAFWQGRDFLFCGVCGTLLSFDSVRSASCPLCGFKRKAKEIEGKETRYTVTDEKNPAEILVFGDKMHVATSLSFRIYDFAALVEHFELYINSYVEAEDIRRELKIDDPFVILESAPKEAAILQRTVVNETCPECRNPKLEYYTMQLRSVDEGHTVFYECPECGHKYSTNT